MRFHAMNAKILLTAGAIALATTVACSGSETPAQTKRDVSAARTEMVKDVAEKVVDSNASVAAARQDASETTAQAVYDVEVAKLEGEHKVQLEKCDAMTGRLRADCKGEADAGLEVATAQAEATLKGQKY
jgi:hypothetical protein